ACQLVKLFLRRQGSGFFCDLLCHFQCTVAVWQETRLPLFNSPTDTIPTDTIPTDIGAASKFQGGV
ncbi:MAG: hypothetical protein ACR2N1_18900, partial [Rubripirellula sp.]